MYDVPYDLFIQNNDEFIAEHPEDLIKVDSNMQIKYAEISK